MKSDNNSPPEDIEVNQAKSLKVTDLYNDAIVFIFNDPDKNDDLCDPFIVNLKHFAVNETSEINAETYCNDEKTGNIKIKLAIKEILSNNGQNEAIRGEIKEPQENVEELKEEYEKLKAQVTSSNELVSSLQSEIKKLKDENEMLKVKQEKTKN